MNGLASFAAACAAVWVLIGCVPQQQGYGGQQAGAGGAGQMSGQPGAAGAFSGTFVSSAGDGTTAVLWTDGATVQGRIDAQGYPYTLTGQVQGANAFGAVHDPQTGGSVEFRATLIGTDQLALVLIAPGGGENDPMMFRRTGGAQAPVAGGGYGADGHSGGGAGHGGAEGGDSPAPQPQGHGAGQAGSLEGTFVAVVNGQRTTIVWTVRGGVLSGTATDSNGQYTVSGQVEGTRVKGTMTVAPGQTVPFEAELAGEHDLQVVLINPQTQQRVEMAFRRHGTGEAPASGVDPNGPPPESVAKAPRDPQMVGTWVSSKTHNSGTGDNFGSMTTRKAYTLTADGKLYSGGSSTSISGATYSGRAGSGGGELIGFWKTEGIPGRRGTYLFISADGVNWQPEARYYIEGNDMILFMGPNEKTRELYTRAR